VPGFKFKTLTGDDDAVPVNPPGLDVAVKDVGIPPTGFIVNGTSTEGSPATSAAVPMVGAPGTSATFVPPADASRYLSPLVLEVLGFVTAIAFSPFN
jgi:hypothetical protein